MIGLVFADQKDAKLFYKKVTTRKAGKGAILASMIPLRISRSFQYLSLQQRNLSRKVVKSTNP